MKNKATIIRVPNGNDRYFDKNGVELFDGDTVKFGDEVKKLYLTVDGELGTDATNPAWIKYGRAVPCEYGIYPLEISEMEKIEKINR